MFWGTIVTLLFAGTVVISGNDSREKIGNPTEKDSERKVIDKSKMNAMDVIFAANGANGEDDTFSTSIPGGLFEADIVMTNKLKQTIGEWEARGEDAVFDAIRNGVWPGGVVPYTFQRGFPYRSIVLQAIGIYKRITQNCIQFKPYTRALAQKARGYVEFIRGGGCYSMIGRQGRGKQQISIGTGCNQIGVVLHEMMHALGFFHEQSRRDRDNYVRVNWQNINRAMHYNFKKYQPREAETLGEPYDKQSVMHYSNYAFSINRRPTLVSRANRNERLGQRKGLSQNDIRQLTKYYQCKKGPGPTKKPTTPKRCKDNFTFCVSLDSWCKRHSFVKANCKKTCKLCGVCKNERSDRSCNYWAGLQYCVKGEFVGFMKDKCKKSCKLC